MIKVELRARRMGVSIPARHRRRGEQVHLIACLKAAQELQHFSILFLTLVEAMASGYVIREFELLASQCQRRQIGYCAPRPLASSLPDSIHLIIDLNDRVSTIRVNPKASESHIHPRRLMMLQEFHALNDTTDLPPQLEPRAALRIHLHPRSIRRVCNCANVYPPQPSGARHTDIQGPYHFLAMSEARYEGASLGFVANCNGPVLREIEDRPDEQGHVGATEKLLQCQCGCVNIARLLWEADAWTSSGRGFWAATETA